MAPRRNDNRAHSPRRKRQNDLPVDLPDDPSTNGISAETIQSGLKAVELLMLAAICSPVSRLSLSPVYGSIPPLRYHSQMTTAAVLLAWTAKNVLRFSLPKGTTHYIPLLAYSIPTIQFYLFTYSGKFGPVYGPLITELLTYFPLVFCSVYSAAAFLDANDLGVYGERLQKAGLGIMSYLMFSAVQKASGYLIGRNVGSSLLFTRSGLQFVIATFYALLLPSKILLLATLPILHSASLNVHAPLQVTTSALNSTLQIYGYSLVARHESLTGYISVLDNPEDGFRVMRCDHSLLGGEWIHTAESYKQKVKEPIYSIFAMLEAVRLIEAGGSKKKAFTPDNQANALVIGLGIGTTPSALIAHGIHTTIVEIDPVVHDFATKYFGLPTNHTSIIEDAITYVEKAQSIREEHHRYDYIIHDVFTGGAEPVDLFTLEFIQGLSDSLKVDGVVAINYAGDLLLPSTSQVVRTVKSVFPTCRLFREDALPAGFSSPGIERPTKDFTNMVMFCRKSNQSFTFRDPVESDYLGSQARRYHLLPTHEIDDNYFKEGTGNGETALLRKGQTQVLEKYQRESAVGHWRIMRTVLPDAIWENW